MLMSFSVVSLSLSTVAPNIASLVKAAQLAHKKPEDTGIPGERADVGAERSGDAKLGMSDEDFGAIVNNLRRAIMAQEGQLSEDMIKQLSALVPYIDEQIKITLANPRESLEDLSDDEQDGSDEGEELTDVEEVVEEVKGKGKK